MGQPQPFFIIEFGGVLEVLDETHAGDVAIDASLLQSIRWYWRPCARHPPPCS